MSHRSLKKQMEGNNYKDKWSQRADDMEWTSNCGKEKMSPRKKRIGANHNITPPLCPRQQQGYLELICMCCKQVHCQGYPMLHWLLHH